MNKRKVLEWERRPFGLKECKSVSQRPVVVVDDLEILMPTFRKRPTIDGGKDQIGGLDNDEYR